MDTTTGSFTLYELVNGKTGFPKAERYHFEDWGPVFVETVVTVERKRKKTKKKSYPKIADQVEDIKELPYWIARNIFPEVHNLLDKKFEKKDIKGHLSIVNGWTCSNPKAGKTFLGKKGVLLITIEIIGEADDYWYGGMKVYVEIEIKTVGKAPF